MTEARSTNDDLVIRDKDEFIIMDQWSYDARAGDIIRQPRRSGLCAECSDERYALILRRCIEQGWLEELSAGAVKLTDAGASVRLRFSQR